MNLGERVFLHYSGALVVGIPVYTRPQEELDTLDGYVIALANVSHPPVGWILQAEDQSRLFGISILDVLEDLGEL